MKDTTDLNHSILVKMSFLLPQKEMVTNYHGTKMIILYLMNYLLILNKTFALILQEFSLVDLAMAPCSQMDYHGIIKKI